MNPVELAVSNGFTLLPKSFFKFTVALYKQFQNLGNRISFNNLLILKLPLIPFKLVYKFYLTTLSNLHMTYYSCKRSSTYVQLSISSNKPHSHLTAQSEQGKFPSKRKHCFLYTPVEILGNVPQNEAVYCL